MHLLILGGEVNACNPTQPNATQLAVKSGVPLHINYSSTSKLQSFCLKKQFNNFQVAGILSSLNTSSHDALLAWTRRQVVDPL